MADLAHCRLYGIIDLSYVDAAEAPRVAKAMVEGGVDLIQLRGKQKSIEELVDLAGEIHGITSRASIPLIANDHVEIAVRVPLEGVHVGQDDDPVSVVRAKAGRNVVVGKSTHSLAQAFEAEREGADYIGFGPVFATPTKPDYKPIGLTDIKQLHADFPMPIFCIGGIKLDTLEQVIAAGARRVVIVSGLLKASNISEYARAAKGLLSEIKHQASNVKRS